MAPYTSGNEAAIRMLGYNREELLRLNFKDIIDPDYLSVAEVNFRKKIQKDMKLPGLMKSWSAPRTAHLCGWRSLAG